MNKIILLVCGVLGLGGCATTHDYFSIVPTQNKIDGLWTGQYDTLVASLKLKADGTGIICQDHLGTARLMSVKLSNDRLYSQDGTYWKLVQVSPQIIKLNYAFGGGYTMQQDNSGTMVSPACKEKI
ncbi:J517_1871 family lipoprotein [Acinetobacter bereziniae]|uniref:J517_1871 family lipoprotein n=1 Tax=Acinetobacter bereziniae TaxID=106648 RepID=UPI003008102B